MSATAFRRALLIPEVVQTSAMDCGPASLQALLAGCGVDIDYDRLRSACLTDVDGSSIDVLEDVAVELGLDAQQTILPADHLFTDAARALPALAVVRLPNGNTHFVIHPHDGVRARALAQVGGAQCVSRAGAAAHRGARR
jgi:ABC-type bacteriocin/lantibiotic exporter with double-glycine peptidase domain